MSVNIIVSLFSFLKEFIFGLEDKENKKSFLNWVLIFSIIFNYILLNGFSKLNEENFKIKKENTKLEQRFENSSCEKELLIHKSYLEKSLGKK